MQVFLDGAILTKSEQTLARAIDVAREAAQRSGRLIIEVTADGQTVSDELLGSPDAAPTFAEVRFTSADPLELIDTALADGIKALEAVRDVQAAAQEALQAGQDAEAKANLHETFQTWMAIQSLANRSIEMLGIDATQFVASGVHGEIPFEHAVTQLLTVLRDVNEAVRKDDASALADLVGYDLQSLTGTWISILESLASRARGMRGGRG